MKIILRSLLTLSLPLAVLPQTRAVFNSEIVGADSQWALHLDLNALRQSTLGKEIVDIAIKAMPPIADGAVQIDLQKLLATIGTITAYGANFSEDPNLIDGTLIFQGTPELRKIAEGFVAQATVTTPENVTELKDLPFEAYSVAGQIIVAFPPEPIILVSKSKAQVIKAREVFRGKSPSLAKNISSPLTSLLKNTGRTYLVAASVVPSAKIKLTGPQARVLQMANSGSISLGERDTQTFAHVQLQAASDEMADKLMKILQGITAMASLAETTDKQLAEFIQSVTVERQNKTVSLSLGYSSERLVQMIQSQQKMESERRQRRPSRPASSASAPKNYGQVVAEWKAEQELGSNTLTTGTLVSRTIANVRLSPGATITLSGQREDGETGRLDCIDVTAAQGAIPTLRFEAEHMKLTRYEIEETPVASGGAVITTHSPHATAQFQFPGTEGTYTLNVFYADESDGKGTFSVSVRDPKAILPEAR